MDVSHDAVIAFVYGELPPEEMRRIERAIAADPELAAFAAEQRRIRDRLAAPRDRFIAQLPAPTRTRAAAKPWIAALALGTGLVLGFAFAGTFGTGGEIQNRGGAFLATGALGHVLSESLASEESAAPRIGASIWSTDGRFCRSFAAAAPGDEKNSGATVSGAALSGIACRENAQWRIVLLDASGHEPGAISPAVTNALAAMQTGARLDAEAERAAREQDWRPR